MAGIVYLVLERQRTGARSDFTCGPVEQGGPRAGTRPAPTGPLWGITTTLWEALEGKHKACPYRTFVGDSDLTVGSAPGQAQGLPLLDRLRGIATSLWVALEGRHKACPYWTFVGDSDHTVGSARGQAQGLPLQDRLGRVSLAKHFSPDTLLGKNEHGGLVRAGRCGGAAPAQGRAEGPDAQRLRRE